MQRCSIVILACPESFLAQKMKRDKVKKDSEQVGMTEGLPWSLGGLLLNFS